MRTITIGDTEFQLIKPRNPIKPYTGWLCDENAIFYAYDNPSDRKIAIWHDWCRWAHKTDGVFGLEISGHSCMTFSIDGGYIDDNGNEYRLYITKGYNRAYLVTSTN